MDLRFIELRALSFVLEAVELVLQGKIFLLRVSDCSQISGNRMAHYRRTKRLCLDFHMTYIHYICFPQQILLTNILMLGCGGQNVGRDSAFGILTPYGLDGLGIESRWGEIFRTRPDRP